MSDQSAIVGEILAGEGKSVSEVARLIPPFRGGKRGTPSLVTRWITDGVRGLGNARVRLEAVRLSGRWVTTAGALSRFLQAQQAELPGGDVAVPAGPAPTRSRRQGQAESAQRALEQLGI